MNDVIDLIERSFQYRFNDKHLLQRALTHRSFSATHNETLEFLGDAVLGTVVAKELFVRFNNAKEGELSRLRASVVSGKALAKVAKQLALGEHLRLGGGEIASGGRMRDSILADSVEAVLGAIFLEAGFEATQRSVLCVLEASLQALSLTDSKDPKTQLQELLQAKKQQVPSYRTLRTEGAQHEQTFFVECTAFGIAMEGTGSSRRSAEQDAAKKLLQAIT